MFGTEIVCSSAHLEARAFTLLFLLCDVRFGYNQGEATKESDVLIEQLLGVWMCAWVRVWCRD
jgi:hypothetical protein